VIPQANPNYASEQPCIDREDVSAALRGSSANKHLGATYPMIVVGHMGTGKTSVLLRMKREQEFCLFVNMRAAGDTNHDPIQQSQSPRSLDEEISSFAQQLGIPRRSLLHSLFGA
jgi:hypothetical protein